MVDPDAEQLAFWPPRRMNGRVELRLDRERKRKLYELARGRGIPLSQLIREMIDRAYEETHGAGDPAGPTDQ